MEGRISRSKFFMETAKLASQRSTCLKKKVGAVLVLENRLICVGYNGVLPGKDASTGIDNDGITHTVHAEANIISFCAKKGIPVEGCDMYTTLSPCEKCAELIIQSGIKRVVFLERYRIVTGIELINSVKGKKCLQYIE